MEVEHSQAQNHSQLTLKDISYFLSNHLDDKDRSASLEERTNCAIVLLESLPCSRHAVLEKIGEVFFDEAQKYVVELERLHLAGMAAVVYEKNSSKLDAQIRKIQQVLVSFVEENPKTWGPMIFNWTVQTLSQICIQYGTKRHFSTLLLEERLQMWLNCTATLVLLEIMVSCLHKIIHKNQDSCLKCLLNSALISAPYFNWVLAHICCIFPHILPYKLLCHASEAFSKQSRKIEIIIDIVLSIFDIIRAQEEEKINNALFKLFTENMMQREDHNVLCAIPFLLHICNKSSKLMKPLVDRVLQSLTHDNLHILHEQSVRRDDILQRRALNRITDCIKEIEEPGYKVLDFLIRYSCQEDKVLIEERPALAASTKVYCSYILELLNYLFANETNIFLHYNRCDSKEQNSAVPVKSPFLFALGTHAKQMCRKLLNSSGLKRNILLEMLKLIALQAGLEKMCEILVFILFNSSSDESKSCFTHFVTAFKVYQPSVIKQTFANAFAILTSGEAISYMQMKQFLRNTLRLEKDDKCGFFQNISVMSLIKPYVKCIAQVTVLGCGKVDISYIALELLQKLSLPDNLIAEYAIVVQTTLGYYFETMKELSVQDMKDCWPRLKLCNNLLVRTINQYMSVHQFIIRILVEGVVRKEEEQFSTETEKPLINVELVRQNLMMVQGNRFSTITSVSFKDGLKLTKRIFDDYELWRRSYTCQLFINTLSSLLSLSGYGPKMMENASKGFKFTHLWTEKKYVKLFPTAHAFLATVLVELVCPEMVPLTPWPDEDFLKYTIERDLKVKNMFDTQPVLWEILEVISTARPSLYHCSVIIQSLFGMSLKFWQTNRNTVTRSSPVELNYTYKIMRIVKNAGWLPSEIDSISDIFPFIKPREVYEILSVIWIYLKNTNYAPDRFVDRDQLNLPSLPVNTDYLQNIRAVVQIVFLRNIVSIGYLYSRFLGDNPT